MSAPDTNIGTGSPSTGIGVGTSGTDGAVVEDGQSITVKPSNGTTTSYQGTVDLPEGGTPSVTLPATVAMVAENDSVGLATSGGSNAGNGTAFVNEGFLTNVRLPAGNALVGDGSSIPLSKEDNTGLLAMVTTHVVNDLLQNIALPHNYAILQDQQASVTVNQYGESGGAAATVSVADNTLSLTLANSTSRIVFNLQPCVIRTVVGTETGFGGLLGVAGGALTGLTLPADAAIVQDGSPITVPVTGTYTTQITPQVNSEGVITGFVLS